MEWYFDNDMEDLVVPNYQELADRLPSPESWSNWGLTVQGNFESSNKCFIVDANLTHDKLKFNGKLCNDAEFESSADVKDPSSCSSMCGGLSQESLNQAPLSQPQPDYQLDDFARFEQMDDIFLSSLLEDLPESEDLHKSFCSSPEYDYVRMPDDCLLTDKEIPALHFIPCKSDHKNTPMVKIEKLSCYDIKCQILNQFLKSQSEAEHLLKTSVFPNIASPAKILFPPEQISANGFVSEGMPHEESVLQDLEMVMAQFSDKTRICFRDAFYRLSKNSKQNPVALNQQGNLYVQTHSPKWTMSEEKIRSGKKETTESETNTIDRTIANLTFNKMETNARDFPVVTPENSKQNVIKTTGQLNQSSSHSLIHYFSQSSVAPSDAEVPCS